MRWIDKVKRWFRKGGAIVTQKQQLTKLTDHPKINMSEREYNRILEDFKLYEGEHKQVEFINSMGRKRKRDFYSLDMTKEVAEYMATIVFNEQCEIEIADQTANEFIAGVFANTNFKNNLINELEVMFATGGLAVKPYIDPTTQTIDYSWCMANTVFPIKSNSTGITDVAIASVTTKTVGNKIMYYTLLEIHEWQANGDYKITNELYESDDEDKVGYRVALSVLFDDLVEETIISNLNKPLFAYIKPNKKNNKDVHSALGIGLCDNAKSVIKAIDNVYDAFNHEIKQGQRKTVVSDHFLRTSIDEFGNTTQYLDEDEDVFVALAGDIDNMNYKDLTSPIRSDDYIKAINEHLSKLEMKVGLSAGTWTFESTGIKTATEVVSENSTTFKTRARQISAVETFIKNLIIATFELAVAGGLYAGKIPEENEIGIDFDDGVFTDKNAQMQFFLQLVAGGLMPKSVAIQRLFGMSEESAIDWLQRINKETLGSDVDYQVTLEESNTLV